MHTDNQFYGHASILLEYCGIRDQWLHPILGRIQHGWLQLPSDHAPLGQLPIKKFMWSRRIAHQAISDGWEDVIAIGAPFLYLLELLEPAPESEREGTIVYPWHGLPWSRIVGDHRRYVDEVLEVEDGPITFCLHWNDYNQTTIRSAYERKGARVVTNGPPFAQDMNCPGALTRDRSFLTRQLAELRRHRRVVSNRLSTAILYGAIDGNEVGIYGPPMFNPLDSVGHRGLSERYPELHTVSADTRAARVIAYHELGRGLLRTPEQLRQVLGLDQTAPWPISEGYDDAGQPNLAAAKAGVSVCAFADELIEAPDLLSAWSEKFSSDDPVVLRIVCGTTSQHAVVEQVLSAMSAAGLSNSEDEARLELLPDNTMTFSAMSSANAVYTRLASRAADAGLARIDDSTIDVVRSWLEAGAFEPEASDAPVGSVSKVRSREDVEPARSAERFCGMTDLGPTSPGHTWLLDLDGTVVKHNADLTEGQDVLLPGAHGLLAQIPESDFVVVITSRAEADRADTERFLARHQIRYSHIIFGAPCGGRIVVDDVKPSGQFTAVAVGGARNEGQSRRLRLAESL